MAFRETEFLYKNTLRKIRIEDERIHLEIVGKSDPTARAQEQPLLHKSIDVLHVIATSCEIDEWKVNRKGRPMLGNQCLSYFQAETTCCFSLTINFWKKLKGHRRKLKTLKLRTFNENDCLQWGKLIASELNVCLKRCGYVRPQNLLVFVNPYGGKKKATRIYMDIVSPLFELAAIKKTVIFTEYSGHAKEYLEANDISAYDGVIAVGGDGTFSDVTNGVLIAEQRKQNIKLDGNDEVFDKPIEFRKSVAKLGMIPAGSANSFNWTCQGIDDPETAVLQIICGESHPLDVSSLYDYRGHFLQFATLGCSYGYLAQVLSFAERLRRYGPVRYDVAAFRAFMKHEEYPCEISYIPSSPSSPINIYEDTSRCRYPCRVCLDEACTAATETITTVQKEQASCAPGLYDDGSVKPPLTNHVNGKLLSETSTVLPGRTSSLLQERIQAEEANGSFTCDASPSMELPAWKVINGQFHVVNASMHACMYDKCPQGIAPTAHLADGTAELWLVRTTSRIRFVQSILTMRKKGRRPRFSFVETHRVKGFRLRPLRESDLTTSRKHDSSNASNLRNKPHNPAKQGCHTTPSGSKCVWTADGEFADRRIFTVWIHRGLINVFAKGIERD